MDATDSGALEQMTRDLLYRLRVFTSTHDMQSGARLYAALQTAAGSNALDPTIQPTASRLLRELRRLLIGPSRGSDSEIEAAKRLALEIHGWLEDRPDLRDVEPGDVEPAAAPTPRLPT